MNKIFCLIIKEWKSFFYTPFALLVLPSFLLLSGSYFYSNLYSYYILGTPSDVLRNIEGLSVTNHLLLPYLSSVFNVLILAVPIITMRSFSEEKKLATYELMVSYPIKPFQILMGKYLGALTLSLLFVLVSLVHLIIVFFKGTPYWPQIFSMYLGAFLFVILYVAMGVVISLMTENQLIAAVLTFGCYLSTYFLKWFAYILGAPFDRICSNFLFTSHLKSFSEGLVYLGDVVMYIVVSAIVLSMGYLKLRKHYQP